MRNVLALLVAFVALSGSVMAEGTATTTTTTPAGAAGTGGTTVTAAKAMSLAPIGMGLSVIGIGVGLGLIGFGAMSGIARQPEQADYIRTAMLIIGGLVEGAGIISLALCFVV